MGTENYAETEVNGLQPQQLRVASAFSLKDSFDQILSNYLDYKTQGFGSHPVGALVRHTHPRIYSHEFC